MNDTQSGYGSGKEGVGGDTGDNGGTTTGTGTIGSSRPSGGGIYGDEDSGL